MTERDLIQQAINHKEKKMKRTMSENVGFGGIIGLIGGYLVSGAYTACMVDGLFIQIVFTAAVTGLGLLFGYLEGKKSKDELEVDLLMLRHLLEDPDKANV